ncbi:MAG: TolC family protein [Verrucomicrobia bacterium]|nr:TolC family protein [Verrucomicrobiota bacterium]
MASSGAATNANAILPIDAYVRMATSNDTEFQEILIDELKLAYQHDLRLPARDLVLSVREEFNLILGGQREELGTTIGLEKSFPLSGSAVALSYTVSPSLSEQTSPSALTASITQPIARNAFGRSTRLLDRIVGLEVDVARYQILEAYEDYLATVIVAYYAWYEAHENLLIAQSSYQQNRKLLENMQARAKQQVALPIDVNKSQLQLLAKQEALVEREATLADRREDIARILRRPLPSTVTPSETDAWTTPPDDWVAAIRDDSEVSRTFSILNLLETRSDLDVERSASDLLPSLDLELGYRIRGDDYGIKRADDLAYAGVVLEWPFGDQVRTAEHELAQIDARRARLTTVNTRQRLTSRLQRLGLQVERERALIAIAEEKIKLAADILKAEEENYSFGKVTLNDYIAAVNRLDASRFEKVQHDVLYRSLLIDWLRLSDRLIDPEAIPRQQPNAP